MGKNTIDTEQKPSYEPYDMDKDKPEVKPEEKRKKKLSRDDLKPSFDVNIDSLLPSPDTKVGRRKKLPVPDEEIKNPIFVDDLQEEPAPEAEVKEGHDKSKEKVRDHFSETEKEEKDEEKLVIKPFDIGMKKPKDEEEGKRRKKLSRDDLRPSFDVNIDSLLPPPDAKVERKKKIEPMLHDEIKNPIFDAISEKEADVDLEKSKEKLRDHFPESEKAKKDEEKIVIKPFDLGTRKPEEKKVEKQRKKLSRDDLKPSFDVNVDSLLPSPDAKVERK